MVQGNQNSSGNTPFVILKELLEKWLSPIDLSAQHLKILTDWHLVFVDEL